MVTVREAKRILDYRKRNAAIKDAPLHSAIGRTLAEDIYASWELPLLFSGVGEHVSHYNDWTRKKKDNNRQLALSKGSMLHAPAIGLLASLGLSSVKVYWPPKVTIIVIGNESVHLGEGLRQRHVYESNSLSLRAALATSNITDVRVVQVQDNRDHLHFVLGNSLRSADLVLLTGEVNAGDYGSLVNAFYRCSVKTFIHSVGQRPNGPFLYGQKGDVDVFGLLGSPSSVLTCFYAYVLPIAMQLAGREGALTSRFLPLGQNFVKDDEQSLFLKGKIRNGEVVLLSEADSCNLSLFAEADCLVFLPDGKSEIQKMELVEIHLLPQYSVVYPGNDQVGKGNLVVA